jgi:hypothetical protein
VSAAFFIESEFQETGNYVYRLYKGALGRRPTYAEFLMGRNEVTSTSELEASKQAYAEAFVERDDFAAVYNSASTCPEFVDALAAKAELGSGVDLSAHRSELINACHAYDDAAEQTQRAHVVRKLIEYTDFKQAEYNPAFVLMQYYGYLRRDLDEDGYQFWLDVINNRAPGNYYSMVDAFITSREYENRFVNLEEQRWKAAAQMSR